MTPRQQQLFAFICDQIEATGITPSYSEMAAALGLTSKGNIVRLVNALIRDGFLVRGHRGSARSLRLKIEAIELRHVSSSALVAELERRGFFDAVNGGVRS